MDLLVSANLANVPPVRRRRNGLQPACEPCRKAKVRCDSLSSQSVCSRCRKRKTPKQCITLDAPMTHQSSGEPKSLPRPKSPSLLPINRASRSSSVISPNEISIKQSESPAFFGSTSFGATIHHSDIDPEIEGQKEKIPPFQDPPINPSQIAMGVDILQQLPEVEVGRLLVDNYQVNLFPKTLFKHMFDALYACHSSHLSQPPGSRSNLEDVSQNIIKNGQDALVIPDEFPGWFNSFSGENCRWEAVGLLFVAMGYGLLSLTQNEYHKLSDKLGRKERKSVVIEMKNCVESCLKLCGDSLNIIVVGLLQQNFLLHTVLYGDSNLAAWRLHHDNIAVATAMGLHCFQDTPSTITPGAEITKRVTACLFWCDKEVAAFMGRPPAWSSRYYSCPPPLNVSDEALIEGGERLREDIAHINSEGWNTKRNMYETTFHRLMVLSGKIQDEIMELFLGNSDQWSMDKVRALKTKTTETFKNAPILLDVTKEVLLACDSDFLLWRLLFIRLEYVRLNFLLERLSVERGGEHRQNLIDMSREMADLTTFLWLQRDRFVNLQYDYDYVLMCYGMPSTGILCSELLRQARHPKTVDIKMSCSEVVQILSFMIGFLEWIRPTAGNYKLCQRMSKVIRRVLDKVFESQVENNQNSESDPANTAVNATSDFWPLDELDDFEWLNSIDWSRGPYMDDT